MKTFRVAFLMERLSPPSSGLTGSFDSTYLNGLKTIVNYITNKGGYAILDPHNFARYNGGVITDLNAYVKISPVDILLLTP
jgi:endoglucanase